MFYILFTVAACVVTMSATGTLDIRLPTYCKQEKNYPYQIITLNSPNIVFKPQNTKYIETKVLSYDSQTTVVKISVKYSSKEPIKTEIIAIVDETKFKIPVNIDIIDHLQITSNSDSLPVNLYSPFYVQAFTSNGEKFSSLNGTQLEWSTTTSNSPFTIYNAEDPTIKKLYDSFLSFQLEMQMHFLQLNHLCHFV